MMRGSARTQEGLRGEGGDRHSTTGGSLCSRRHIPTTRLRRRVGREDSMFGEGRREKGEGRREKGEGRREKGDKRRERRERNERNEGKEKKTDLFASRI